MRFGGWIRGYTLFHGHEKIGISTYRYWFLKALVLNLNCVRELLELEEYIYIYIWIDRIRWKNSIETEIRKLRRCFAYTYLLWLFVAFEWRKFQYSHGFVNFQELWFRIYCTAEELKRSKKRIFFRSVLTELAPSMIGREREGCCIPWKEQYSSSNSCRSNVSFKEKYRTVSRISVGPTTNSKGLKIRFEALDRRIKKHCKPHSQSTNMEGWFRIAWICMVCRIRKGTAAQRSGRVITQLVVAL